MRARRVAKARSNISLRPRASCVVVQYPFVRSVVRSIPLMRPCPQCSQTCDSSHRFCPACGYPIGAVSLSDDDALIGSTLAGGYVILELIGVGGMGRVYRAEQTTLGRTVAVKIIHPALHGDESASARFISEARTASLMNHPNSVSIIDFGRTDTGQLYLVMEYLRGRDLARVLAEDGPLPFHRIIEILRQTLAALAEAHHVGVIHRDLKPENIVIEPMRTGGDFVKVVDFGLAKLLTDSNRPGITASGIVCGTPDYMAPEQGRGDPIDARADLYSVGVILYQLLTGRLPFEADSPTQVVLKHLTVSPTDPRTAAPERAIPASLALVTLSALAKEPAARYQDAESFSAALVAAKNQLDTTRSSPPDQRAIACPVCKARVPSSQRFCGECGARVSSSSTRAVSPPATSSKDRPVGSERHAVGTLTWPLPFVARDQDLAWLLDRHAQTDSELVAARIVGGPGLGKTRLVREFLQIIGTEGDVVVESGPDPWWAQVAYYALRSCIDALSSLSDGTSRRSWPNAPAEVQAGLATIYGHSTADVRSPREVRRCVAAATRWALQQASQSVAPRRVVLFIDDLHRVDGASRNAIADSLSEPLDAFVPIIAAHHPGFAAYWPGNHPARVLQGLSQEQASSLLQGIQLPPSLNRKDGRGLPPMYLEQLLRFSQEGGTDPPTGLADLVSLRIARLEADARRVLQAIAVIGKAAQTDHVARLAEDIDLNKTLRELTSAGMIVQTDEGVSVSHPIIREIAAATIPAGVRRGLHATVGEMAPALALPLEARALHALTAQDAFEALLLLDQVGDQALSRDDVAGAVLAFRRGLDLARREIFRGELDDPMRAVLIFSRKLGEALTRAGDITDADGVLREALDLADPAGEDRARVLFALANVARARQRPGDATRYLREAIELAYRTGSDELIKTMEQTGRSWV